ncbi:MAG: hypothetical protein KA214_05700, partial [Neisseriaceae bacterium]|nr:hypothetical protein [Neisseriaceae bacterium]
MSASLKTIQFSLGLFVYTLHLNSYAACIDNGTVFDCDNTISGNPDAKYQTVNITTTAIGGTAPLAGFGVYGNNNTQFRFNTLNVNTTGKDADALRLRIIASMDIDKLVIHTSGSSADAINVTDEAKGSTLRIGDNALITAQSGVGIRVNSGPDAGKNNVVTLGKNAYIETHGSGSNAIDTVGYAVYAGNRNWQAAKAKGNAIIHLGDDSTIITHGNNAHAVYANRGGGITLGHTTIRTDHKGAYGLYAETLSTRSSYIA